MLKKCATLAWIFVIAAATLQGACGYPTSCSIIPTADILQTGSVRFEFENDGLPKVGESGSIYYGFTQIGLTPRVEFGIDRYDVSGEPQDNFNAKFLLVSESPKAPALAVGIMDVADGSKASYYGIATRTFGRFRLHAGYIHAEYANGAMLGAEQQVAKGTYLLEDWTEGSGNYLSLGIYRELNKNWGVTLLHGWANGSGAEDLTAINLSYTIPLWKPAGASTE